MTKLDPAAADKAVLLALARRIRAHEHGTCAFSNSIGAEFGWSSPVGRWADGARFANPPLALGLEDLADSYPPQSELQPTAVAQRMIEHEHRRLSRRLRPMPPASRAAALAYLEERRALYERAEAIFRRSSHGATGWRAREARWHLKRLARIEDWLRSRA